ncbi:dipeptide epimerase [Saccharibacillus sp. CPCC 101409]|uniref:mandelate racemase/muconate lactonizing enzyme family protein n=1 Tax=Saccharibacillus sp. CPCC 101409 TaxID=3058041 RepID=UPI00267114C8|nr:dipeptide epimerase [Saccharibacillus sp. CPCC 101409]MDO3408952.1 dipeptide epimerase [Saccharibacillus sp. CPCC 101409]
MQIQSIEAKKIKLELLQPVKIAIGTLSRSETVIVRIVTDDGIVGCGEGSGVSFVTGETADTIDGAVRVLAEALIGRDALGIDRIHRIMDRTLVHNTSAKAAIDIALHDILGKAAKLPLHRLLGAVSGELETDKTVGIGPPEQMVRDALEMVVLGFGQLKIKAGLDPDADIEAVRLIREAVGPQVRLKVDANQGWSAKDALRAVRAMAECGVEAVEQPVPQWDTDGLALIRAQSPLDIMADESCFSPRDAALLVKREAVDLINIKLMKCGGLHRAMQINAVAEASGVGCMLGCMMESRIGIAAGAALVLSRPNFKYADLDSFMYFHEVPAIRGGFVFETPHIRLADGDGIGVEVDF